jgi:hypothetical protein
MLSKPLTKFVLPILFVLIFSISIIIQIQLFYRFSLFNPDYRKGDDRRIIEFSEKIKNVSLPGDTVALWELGLVGYYSERYIIDFAGLATPEIIKYRKTYRTDYLTRFFEDKNIVPKYIAIYYPKEKSILEITRQQDFGGHPYNFLFFEKFLRIGGKFPKGHYDYCALYKRCEF